MCHRDNTMAATRDVGVNARTVGDADLQRPGAEAGLRQWLEENAEAFAAQADWHGRNGHPLADILATPGKPSWTT